MQRIKLCFHEKCALFVSCEIVEAFEIPGLAHYVVGALLVFFFPPNAYAMKKRETHIHTGREKEREKTFWRHCNVTKS